MDEIKKAMMTREYAIDTLQRMKYPYKCKRGRMLVSNVNENNEALDMAIKALSQEPCEDAKSTKEVMKILTALMSEAGKEGKLILSDAKEMIMDLPSVQPKQKGGAE